MAGRVSKKNNNKMIAAGVGAIVIIMILMGLMGDSSTDPQPMDGVGSTPGLPSGKVEYSIMFDAGSSGSRIHVFKFIRPHSNPQDTLLVEEFFEQLKPGLSSYSTDAAAGAASLKPLLEKAMGFIPAANRASTPIALRATAGLRMLGTEQAQALLDASYALFQKYPFQLATKDKAVFIMDGVDEGVYAWVTVNYLLGKLGKVPGETVGVMDLGGGSSQIAFAVDETALSAAEQSVVGPKLHRFTFAGRTYTVYAHSYLGYGLNSARGSIMELAADANPCLPEGYENKDKFIKVKAFGKAGGAEECTQMVRGFITTSHTMGKHQGWERSCEDSQVPCGFDGVPQPKPAATMKFFALSFFYDLPREHELVHQSVTEPKINEMPIATYEQVTKGLCGKSLSQLQAMQSSGSPWSEIKSWDLATSCLDFTYAHALLTLGYHRPASDAVLMADSIPVNGKQVETQWCLGAALQAMQPSA